MQTMSPLDASFLHIEDAVTHMHIGSVGIFEGPLPACIFNDHKLHLMASLQIQNLGPSCEIAGVTEHVYAPGTGAPGSNGICGSALVMMMTSSW